MKKYRVLLITCEDVDNPKGHYWSGTTYYSGRAVKKQFKITGTEVGYPWFKKYGVIRKKILKGKPDFTLLLASYDLIGKYKPFAIYLDSAFVSKHEKQYIMLDKTFKKATAIFTFSEYERKAIIKDYKVIPSKIFTVGAGPNLCNLPKIKNKKFDGKTILFVGGAFSRKGGLVLLEAFKKVKEKIPDARLIIVSKEVYKYSKKTDLKSHNILFYDYADKRTLGYLYRRASLFVLPSLSEPFGIVFLEAMSYKLPCIGTKIFAMPEIIDDGKTGFLVKPKDPNDLAKKIIYLLLHKKVSRRMGKLGYNKIKNYYSWHLVLRRIEERMSKILYNKGRSPFS